MAEPSPEAEYEPHALKKVNETYHELLDTVDTLNVKIGKVLSRQESEFLRSYRGHLYGVKKEVEALKSVASAAAATLARDSKVKEVETARDWYRAEAVRLDDLATRQRGELVALRERLGAQTQDALWQTERSREAARAHNKLAAELSASRALGASAAAALEGGGLEAQQQALDGAAAEQPAPARSGAAAVGRGTLALLSPARRRALLDRLGGGSSGSSSSSGSGGGAEAGAGAPSERERALEEEVGRLRREVEELREELEAERGGREGGAGAGADSSSQEPRQQHALPARQRAVGAALGKAGSPAPAQAPSAASQNLPPGLKPSLLGPLLGVKQ